jgi:hypothetical protein
MTGTARWKNYPEDSEAESGVIAKLVYQRPNGKRHTMRIDCRDQRDADRRVVAAVGNIRAGGNRMVRTDMTIGEDDWAYEYDATGKIENVFKNGEVTP